MPIYLDKANLIVSKEIIREKYQGGEEKFKADMNFGKRAITKTMSCSQLPQWIGNT